MVFCKKELDLRSLKFERYGNLFNTLTIIKKSNFKFTGLLTLTINLQHREKCNIYSADDNTKKKNCKENEAFHMINFLKVFYDNFCDIVMSYSRLLIYLLIHYNKHTFYIFYHYLYTAHRSK